MIQCNEKKLLSGPANVAAIFLSYYCVLCYFIVCLGKSRNSKPTAQLQIKIYILEVKLGVFFASAVFSPIPQFPSNP